jgi:8-oxo-dGTP pyrophosphatase MutT (NUDIX family)
MLLNYYNQFYNSILNKKNFKISPKFNPLFIDPLKTYSGVLVIIHFPQNIPTFLFTKRSLILKNHAGEISFPGGKFSKSDKSFLDTAIRETSEEIGITINKNQVIGCLNPVYTYTSNILVYPYVALREKITEKLYPNLEVEEIINIPMEQLKTSIFKDEQYSTINNMNVKFVLERYTIWGATAKILKELLDVLMQ